MTLELRHTDRGFALYEGTDRSAQPYSLQESSLATEPAIWLGLAGHRMHLTREQAAELLLLLRHFAETGQLPGSAR